MNGLELLTKLGVPQELISNSQAWSRESATSALQNIIDSPLKTIISPAQTEIVPGIDGKTGVLKGSALFEVVSYRDVAVPLPMKKSLESTGEETAPQFSYNRTLKLLLTDGTDRTFVAMEYEPCPGLTDVRLNAKIQVTNCYYHMGVLLLTPDTVKLIGVPKVPWTDESVQQ